MGKYKRKNRKSPILTATFILLISCLTLLIINNSINIYKFNFKYSKIEKKIKKLEIDLNKLENENKEYNKQIDTYKNIDSDISNLKKDVFILASELEKTIENNETKYKIAYLTFDDGPYYNTHKVLDILKKNKVKATFFTIGYKKDTCYDNKNESCKEVYKEIVDNGHTIANHTYSHAIFKGLYESKESFMEQVKLQENLIKERTGIVTNIVRFPGGSATAKALKQPIINELRKNGYGWVDWTAEDGDGGYISSKEVAWNNLKKTLNDDIEVILFHDYNLITTSILDDFIKYLEDNNYILLPLFYESIKINK